MKLNKILLIAAAALASASCTKKSNSVQWLSHDFALVEGSSLGVEPRLTSKIASDREACEKRLRKIICQTDADRAEILQFHATLDCESPSEDQVAAAMGLFDEMPEKMRPLYCSLDRIFLSDNLPSVAFASAVHNMGRVDGAFVGFRKSSFLSDLTATQLVTWKEQLVFGGSETFLSNDPKLVQVDYDIPLTHMKSGGLYYVLMHELGHIVDMQNKKKAGFTELSWESSSIPRADATFEYRDEVCYYECEAHLRPENAQTLYASLKTSAFLSVYSSVNSFEDFAEAWAWSILRDANSAGYLVHLPGGESFDMGQAMTENAKIASKLQFMHEMRLSPETKIGF